MTTEDDSTVFEHEHITARSAAELHTLIVSAQKQGYELVSVVTDANAWHEFMKRDCYGWLSTVATTLDEINTGIGMLIENHPNLVTSSRLDELQSVAHCILRVLERQSP